MPVLRRLTALLLLLAAPVAVSSTLLQTLNRAPADVDSCSFYTEEAFRELLGTDGRFFSQSVDVAYRRLADEASEPPLFSGCWWQLAFDNDAFVMMQLQLHPMGSEAAIKAVDEQLQLAQTLRSSLAPEAIDGIGHAAMWSPLSGLVRWRQADGVVIELLISERPTLSGEFHYDAEQLKSMMIRAASSVANAIGMEYPAAVTSP